MCRQLHAVRVGPPPKFEPIAGSEFVLDADLVLHRDGLSRTRAQRHDRAARRVLSIREATLPRTRTT